MTANVGGTKTATFKVTGADLTGNVTLTLSGASVFSISPTTITAARLPASAWPARAPRARPLP